MRQVSAFSVCLWLATVACTAGLIWLSGRPLSGEDLPDFGLVFLGYALVTSLVARRCLDVSMIIVAMWGASVGFWGPRWVSLSEVILDKWATITPLPEAFDQPDVRLALSIGAAGLLTAALLYIPTRSSRVVLQTAAAGIGVGALIWMPLLERWEVEAGAMLWHAVVSAGLCSWMVQASRLREAGCCPRCGNDARGLSSPVCPSCGAALASGDSRVAPVTPRIAQRPI